MTNDLQNLSSWFSDRPKWQQEAASLLVSKNLLNNDDIAILAEKCLEEADGQTSITSAPLPVCVFEDSSEAMDLHLCSLSNVKGINALAPRKPLEFGQNNLVIAYGGNGSGKSGYVRMLKHASGSRSKGPLHANVFSTDDHPSSVDIKYNIARQDIVISWSNSVGAVQDLCNMSIYDDGCARLYVEGENEVTYEPAILTFFSDLISICENVGTHIEKLRSQNVSCKPDIPREYIGTTSGLWYTKITSSIPPEEIASKTEWNDEHAKTLAALEQRIAEKSPADRVRELTAKKKHIDDLVLLVEDRFSKLGDINCRHILNLKHDKLRKQSIVQIAAEELSSISFLDGIGSDVWKQMWEYARRYAEGYAYKGQSFPLVEQDARCVLCHQPLSEDAQRRLTSFESFVKGQAEKDLQTSTKALDEAIAAIGELPTPQTVKLQCDAAGLIYDGDIPPIAQCMLALSDRKEKLLKAESLDDLPELPDNSIFIVEAKRITEEYSENTKKYLEDEKSDNREELVTQLRELKARKWISEQKDAVRTEIDRLKLMAMLDKAKQLTVTTGLSRKKGEIAESVITEAFVSRFSHELDLLKASWLKVEMARTKTSQGRVLHGIRLISAKPCKPSEVLSEGERRVISLAAFLADVTGKPHKAPFIFDDPISSLDQEYEEAVAERLVSLSSDRQVIVFTHRISLLVLLQEYLTKENRRPDIMCIRVEPWGIGEPCSPPFYAQKPESALNSLRNQRLSEAKKAFSEHGHETYSPLAKSICSDLRILLERIIEFDLLADIVQRFRRAINTLGKLDKLPKIKNEDCAFLDALMTKYSRHEHSQPSETPLPPPLPSELEDDLKKLHDWRAEFIARAA